MISERDAVASCASIGGATAQLGIAARNDHGTTTGTELVLSMTGRQLRAQLRAQQGRNTAATRLLQAEHESCAYAAANDVGSDTGVIRRRQRVHAMLDADPNRRLAVIAEAGDPAHVTVAIRAGQIGELTIPAERYDGFALLALMEQYGNA